MKVGNKQAYIRDKVEVSRSMVIQAKRFILSEDAGATESLLEKFLDKMKVPFPKQALLVNEHVDYLPALDAYASSISWTLACCEAFWELIHANLLIQKGTQMSCDIGSVAWTEVMPGSGGSSGGWSFSDMSIPVPATTIRPPSLESESQHSLSDPDIYLTSLEGARISEEVVQSLRDAVRCFRAELYVPCLAMLCKAAEGAWVELGLALVTSLPEMPPEGPAAIRSSLEAPSVWVASKVDKVVELLTEEQVFLDMRETSGIQIEDIRAAAVWTDTVQESGFIRFGVTPALQNDYEKVAALLIGAVPHLRLLYDLRQAVSNNS